MNVSLPPVRRLHCVSLFWVHKMSFKCCQPLPPSEAAPTHASAGRCRGSKQNAGVAVSCLLLFLSSQRRKGGRDQMALSKPLTPGRGSASDRAIEWSIDRERESGEREDDRGKYPPPPPPSSTPLALFSPARLARPPAATSRRSPPTYSSGTTEGRGKTGAGRSKSRTWQSTRAPWRRGARGLFYKSARSPARAGRPGSRP